ncbi:GDYXXLXY domain-containing protein [Bosea rubneri]|uniref:GDYXXLXY domain-containing protein n=1 Tax=Bosea rubneri TaxID=3075434 RepID=A0ABU3SAV0_9HYPH|nr:GDYXXLXY domain-containing protein [Bosea sp. ZW T0_25]MDU0341909.1 GDYXXLXY domain-containing protein [Bosea sp. ZW T0_25]
MIRLPAADQLVGRVPVLWRALAAILILGGLILLLVESRARILRAGTEVRLATAPVDPRDLFRGDYVILNYKISTLDPAALDGEKSLRRNQIVYVRLAPGADGFAEAKGVYLAPPALVPGESAIEGRVTSTSSCLAGADGEPDCKLGTRAIRVAYGLESYFVPQGTGLAIERTERKRIEIIAAVAPSGQAAIKRLLIDGKLVHAEPPY